MATEGAAECDRRHKMSLISPKKIIYLRGSLIRMIQFRAATLNAGWKSRQELREL